MSMMMLTWIQSPEDERRSYERGGRCVVSATTANSSSERSIQSTVYNSRASAIESRMCLAGIEEGNLELERARFTCGIVSEALNSVQGRRQLGQ